VDNLPVGLQLIGKHFDDTKLLQYAWAFEQSTEHHQIRPTLPEEVSQS